MCVCVCMCVKAITSANQRVERQLCDLSQNDVSETHTLHHTALSRKGAVCVCMCVCVCVCVCDGLGIMSLRHILSTTPP